METKTIQIPEGRVIDREKSTDTTIVMTEDKKIEEICDYIFKYEHYNSFYQYAVACAKAVAEWKNRETVNKVVEWLKSLDFEIYNEQKQGVYIWYTIFNKDKFIESFKKAMEE